MFALYWQFIGYPYSIISSGFSDLFIFNLTEVLLWVHLFLFLVFIKKRRKYFFVIYPVILLFSQGATPFDLAPSQFRKSVIITDPVAEKKLSEYFNSIQNKLLQEFDTSAYERFSISNHDSMELYQKIVWQAFDALKQPRGVQIKRIKTMFGFTKVLGLIYGGPGFHDVVTTEAILISQKDYPTSKYWRIKGFVHEIIHAQGVQSELETEILTWLSLRLSTNPLLRALSYQMALRKTSRAFELPDTFFWDIHNMKIKRNQKLDSMFYIKFPKKFLRNIGLFNKSSKYGKSLSSTALSKSIFFKTIYHLENKIQSGSLSLKEL